MVNSDNNVLLLLLQFKGLLIIVRTYAREMREGDTLPGRS